MESRLFATHPYRPRPDLFLLLSDVGQDRLDCLHDTLAYPGIECVGMGRGELTLVVVETSAVRGREVIRQGRAHKDVSADTDIVAASMELSHYSERAGRVND